MGLFPTQKSSFGYDNLAVSIGFTLSLYVYDEHDHDQTLLVADWVHQGWYYWCNTCYVKMTRQFYDVDILCPRCHFNIDAHTCFIERGEWEKSV